MNDTSARPPRVPARLVLASICGLWLTYFLLTTLRGALLGYEFNAAFLSRRLVVTVGSMAVTAALWPLFVALARRRLWQRATVMMIVALPAALLVTMINSWVFADLDHQAGLREQQQHQQQGVNILDDGEGNVVVLGNGHLRVHSDDGSVVELGGGKLVVRDGSESRKSVRPPAPPVPPIPPAGGEATAPPAPPAPPEPDDGEVAPTPPTPPAPPGSVRIAVPPLPPPAASEAARRVVRAGAASAGKASPPPAPAASGTARETGPDAGPDAGPESGPESAREIAAATASAVPGRSPSGQSSFWDEYADLALGRYFLLLAWMALYLALEAAEKARAAERREGDYRRAAQAAELRSLRYQINPHFLFNTLNSLSALVLTGKSAAAEQMIQTLSVFYRRSLTSDPTGDVSLEEEIGLQKLYLEIEAVRFPERLRPAFEVPLALADALVPGMILQPLVENSIKYAVAASRTPVTVTIAARAEGDMLVLSVSDDGPCTEPGGATQDGCGIGLANVRDRLRARFDGAASIEAGPQLDGGFRTVIRLPLLRRGHDRDPAHPDR